MSKYDVNDDCPSDIEYSSLGETEAKRRQLKKCKKTSKKVSPKFIHIIFHTENEKPETSESSEHKVKLFS